MTTKVPYYRPLLEFEETQAVVECIKNGWLTSGPKAKEFEKAFADRCGVSHAIALNSCTAGLHLGLIAMGVGPGDEVVMPSLTFVAGAQCALHVGAIPVFADVDERTLCITADTIQRVVTNKTKAIMPMQYGGSPLNIEAIVSFAHARGIKVLEDAAHAVGTLNLDGRWAGALSDGAAYSFYATKNITSGEGGMFVTNNEQVAESIRVLSLHGMDRDAWKRYTHGSTYRYDVKRIGFKYNMPDIAAAMGIVQLNKLQSLQKKREEIASFYLDELSNEHGLVIGSGFSGPPGRHSWCIFSILVNEDEIGKSRDQVIDDLLHEGIGTSVHFIPTHRLTAFRSNAADTLPITEQVGDRLISLPLYPGMTPADSSAVIAALHRTIRTHRSSASV